MNFPEQILTLSKQAELANYNCDYAKCDRITHMVGEIVVAKVLKEANMQIRIRNKP